MSLSYAVSVATRSGRADPPARVPAFRKLDAGTVLTARLLPAPLEVTQHSAEAERQQLIEQANAA